MANKHICSCLRRGRTHINSCSVLGTFNEDFVCITSHAQSTPATSFTCAVTLAFFPGPNRCNSSNNLNLPQQLRWRRGEFQDPQARFIQALPRCPESLCGESCSRVPPAFEDPHARQCLAGPSSCPVSLCGESCAKTLPSFFLPSCSPRRQPSSNFPSRSQASFTCAVTSDGVHRIMACWVLLLQSFGAEQHGHTRWPTNIFAHACVEVEHISILVSCIPSRNKAEIGATSFASLKYSAFMQLIMVHWCGGFGDEQ